MRVRALTIALALAVLAPLPALATSPTPTGLSAVPAVADDATALAGSWFDGTISSIQSYDRDTGIFADPNGEGFYFIFEPDGSYREGAVISNTQLNCSMRLLGENQGTWSADAEQLVLDQTGGSISITNTCGDSGIYPQGVRRSVYQWSVGPDDYSTETLSLSTTDGAPYGRFHRWAE